MQTPDEIRNALARCQAAIHANPQNFEAHFALGNILLGLKRFDEAIACYDRVIALQPNHGDAHVNRANALANLGRHEEALAGYARALSLNPANLPAHINQGIALGRLNRFEEALASYGRAVSLKPDLAVIHSLRGNTLIELGRFEEALACYDKAASLGLQDAIIHLNRGNALKALHRRDEALACYDRGIALSPGHAEGHRMRGNLLVEMKRYDEALEAYDRAVALQPANADYHANRGVALSHLKRFAEALASFDRSIALKPGNPEAFGNRGVALSALGRDDEALVSYGHAVALKPDHAEAYRNRGNLLLERRRFTEALENYARALELKPDADYLKGQYLHAMMHICDWHDPLHVADALVDEIRAGKKVALPFPLVALIDDPATQKSAAEIYVENQFGTSRPIPPIPPRPPHEKIRIGYFSSDFYNHATMHLMAEMLEQHDHTRFELVAFSFGPGIDDEWSRRAAACFDRFLDVRTQSDREIALLARELEIDIAVDLKGFTQDSRPGIFAERAAPIQASYLGYPGTMGAPFIDYLIADRTLIPEAMQSFYSEKIVYLPDSYQANDTRRRISDMAFTRTELGLPDETFVFCCFNSSYKILPTVFDIWMRLLDKVENSVLWLLESHPQAVDNLRKEAAARGVDPSRLIFAKQMPIEDHLARTARADLFLDTFPCNAHTTASDALRTGLPLLTCAGESFASRVAASLLNAVGMPELITLSLNDYEALALDLALHPDKLTATREKLNDNLRDAPLYDMARFTNALEAAYDEIYRRYREGTATTHIYIDH